MDTAYRTVYPRPIDLFAFDMYGGSRVRFIPIHIIAFYQVN